MAMLLLKWTGWVRMTTRAMRSLIVGTILIAGGAPSTAAAQGTPAPGGSAAAMLQDLIGGIESALTGVAETMPADKYEFAPTNGEFRGVRTFSRQIKHAAAVQHLVAATILGERITADMVEERGPDSVRTKDEVLQYLRESFAALKRAAATVDESNAFTFFKGPFGGGTNNRLGMISVAVTHSWNHYGQVVPYLRMNGLTPQ
jgi:uncharacterized damage-inducible protein DinB